MTAPIDAATAAKERKNAGLYLARHSRPPPPPNHSRCSRCSKVLPSEHFLKANGQLGASTCRECRRYSAVTPRPGKEAKKAAKRAAKLKAEAFVA